MEATHSIAFLYLYFTRPGIVILNSIRKVNIVKSKSIFKKYEKIRTYNWEQDIKKSNVKL